MKKKSFRATSVLLENLESKLLLSAAAVHFSPSDDAAALQFSPLLVSAKAASPVLLAPANVAATAPTSTQVNLTWTPSTGATGYTIYRSTNRGSFAKWATISPSNTFVDTAVTANTKYSYYIKAFNNATLSQASDSASVTTPAKVVITAPAAPSALAVTAATTSSLSLAWTDAATNESGYRVYRSTDGTHFSQLATLPANSSAYTDTSLPAGTKYYYQVSAWNSAGETKSPSINATTATPPPPLPPPPTPPVLPPTDPINIFTRYGNELVLAGTTGNDSITVSESGATLTIVANGITSTAAAPADGLFIYSDGGSDSITVNSSVTLHTTIASIDGSATTISNADANANIWMDSTDVFSGTGLTHSVASYYQNVSKAAGLNLADPTDTGAITKATGSLWGAGPVMTDINQGGVGDCYFLSSLGAFANTNPNLLRNMAVDLGDGTYAVQYLRNGISTVVRVDADMPAGGWTGGFAYAHPGSTGDIWALVMEKSYAEFRTGANTFASLSSGWMGAVYSDLGVANTSVSLNTTDASFYSTMSTKLATGKAVTFGTYSTGTALVASHAYALVSVTNVNGVNYYTVRNPWGFAGDALENSAGLATLTFAQMQANFQLGAAAI